ncbi:MAG: efflux RND transporter periplasmic adaptor subunit [Pseudomonadales bacterium]|nr:MAG: efflux RND transporter periplasmic adaptor subunit [Pseudomonadales bacterium]
MKKIALRYLATLLVLSAAPVCFADLDAFFDERDKPNGSMPDFDCVIEPSAVVDAGSSVPGLLESIGVDRSDMVTSGEVVAKLESSVEKAALKRARAQARSTASVELREESLKLGQITEQRNAKLYSMSAISEQDMQQLETESRIAQLQVKQEQHNRHVAQLDYQRAKAALERLTIRSPINGVITDRFKAVGEYVEDEPIIRIAKLDPLFIEVVVPVDHLGSIQAGMQAEVTPSIAGDNTYRAVVQRVDRVADAASGTFGVRLSLPNPDYKIPAGLRCKIAFNVEPVDSKSLAELNHTEAETSFDPALSANPWVFSPPLLQAAKQPVDLTVGELPNTNNTKVAESAQPPLAQTIEDNQAAASPKPLIATKPVLTPEPASQSVAANANESATLTPAKTFAENTTLVKTGKKPPAAIIAAPMVNPPTDIVSKLLKNAIAQSEKIDAASSTSPNRPKQKPMVLKPRKAVANVCYSIGPVATERQAHQIAGQVAGNIASKQKSDLVETLRGEKSLSTKGYYVLTPVIEDDQQMGQTLDQLNAAGFSDHMLIQKGENKNRISLGYFHREKSALERLEKMQSLGFDAAIAEKKGTTKKYWLDFSGPDHRELKSELQKIASSAAPNAALQTLDCAPAVAAR